MKRMLWTLLMITFLAGVSGCCWPPCLRLPGCILGSDRNCLHGAVGSATACGAEGCPEACGQCSGAGCESCSDGVCQDCGGAGCENCGPAGCEPGAMAGCEACGGAGCEACCGAACGRCGLLGCAGCAGPRAEQFTPGPPTGTITYPYYTNRGPRDFLAKNPPSIGP
jgi:hypothetical protein